MILRQVKLQGYRCFRNALEVGPFGDGLNMIFAPNETGKSTLVEAIARAMFERHKAGGREMDAMRPWDASGLAPQVTLEFEAGGDQYLLEKRFLDQPAVTLSRREGRGYVSFSERDNADDWLRECLHGEPFGRATKPEHWGLARALWVLQTTEGEGVYVPSAVCQQIRSALPDTTAATSAFDGILRSIDRECLVYFTEKNRPRSGAQSPFAQPEEAVESLRLRLAQARSEYERARQAAEELKGVELQLQQIDGERGAYNETAERYREAATQVAAVRAALAQVQQAREGAHSAANHFDSEVAAFDALKQDAQRFQELLDQRGKLLSEAQTNRAAAAQNEQEAEADLRLVQGAATQSNQAWQRAARVAEALHAAGDITQIEKQVELVEGLSANVIEVHAALATLPAPTDDEVGQARGMEKTMAGLRAQLQAAGLQIDLTLERDQAVIYQGEGDPEEIAGAEGQTLSWRAGASAKLRLPGVALLSLRSGAEQPARLEEDLTARAAELADLLGRFAVEDVDALLKLRLAREKANEDHTRLKSDLKRALAPFLSLDDARSALAQSRGQQQQRLVALKIDAAQLEEMPSPDLDGLERDARQADERRQQAADRLGTCRARVHTHTDEEKKMAEAQAEAAQEVKERETRAAQILTSAGCANRDQMVEQQQTLAASLAEVEEKERALTIQLPEPENDPEKLLQTAQAALRELASRREQLLQERRSFHDRIDEAQRVGRWEVIADLEEQATESGRRLQQEYRRAYAVRLLREVLRQKEAGAVASALPGLEASIDRMLQAVTGRPRSISLSSGLSPASVTDGPSQMQHEVTALSGGTREQLELVVRIALGETYAEQYGRTVMVLDDALLYTDPYRHDRIKEVIKRAADKLQVFILTSHPDRYRGMVPPECQFDLARLVRESTGA